MDKEHTILRISGAQVDLQRRRVVRGSEERSLTELEARLLGYLSEREGRAVTREELLTEVWGYASGANTRAVDFAVHRLREKIYDPHPPEHLQSVHGVGYRLVTSGPGEEYQPVTPIGAAPRLRIATGDLSLARATFQPSEGPKVTLTSTEVRLLEVLARDPGQPVPRESLMREVWGSLRAGRSLESTLGRLKRKIERDPASPEALVSVRGFGLLLRAEALSAASRTNLSPPSAPFVDRPERMLVLDALLGGQPVTITGIAGSGKTRLAREVAWRHLAHDPALEAWLFDLAPVEGADGIIQTVAAVLGGPPSRAIAVRPRGSLFVFDNFEHLSEHKSLIEELSSRAPHQRFLVTSQRPLGFPREREIALGPLPKAAGVRLYLERAGRESDEHAPSEIEALVGALDGHPLAIELAAARSRQLPPRQFLARLGEQMDLLVRRHPASESRHSTLRGAFDASFDLLDSEERGALCALSCFAAPFSTRSAGDLLDADAPALLHRLRSRSLLQRAGPDRFCLLPILKGYAAERLALRPDAALLRGRWAAAVIREAESHRESWLKYGRSADRRRLVALRADLLAVIEAGIDTTSTHRALEVLLFRWSVPSDFVVVRRVLARKDLSVQLRCRLHTMLATEQLARAELAAARAEIAAADHPEIDPFQRGILLSLAAEVASIEGEPTQAISFAQHATRLLDEAGQPAAAVSALARGAVYLCMLGQYDRARSLFAEASARFDGARSGILLLLLLAESHVLRSALDLEAARARAVEALKLAWQLRFERWVHLALIDIVWCEIEMGRLEVASRRLRRLELQCVDRPLGLQWVQLFLALLLARRGALDQALGLVSHPHPIAAVKQLQVYLLALLQRSEEAASLAATLPASAQSCACRAAIAAQLGQIDEARRLLREASTSEGEAALGLDRLFVLTASLVDLAEGRPDAERTAAEALAGGRTIRADDGQPLEQPVLVVQPARWLLERALIRGSSPR